MKKRILLTGATGFLGFRLVDFLLDEYDVTGIGRDPDRGCELEGKGVRFIRLNMENREELNEKLSDFKFDYIIHLAAKSTLWGKYDDFYKVNVVGAGNILEYSAVAGIERLIHISTPSAYDLSRKTINLNENDPVYERKFPNHYVSTKIRAEKLILQDAGIDTIILRPRGIFGPGDTSILPRIIQANRKFGIPFVNSGMNLVDITYVDNVCSAICLSLKVPMNRQKVIYNIGSGSPVELHRLLDIVENSLGEKIKRKKIPLIWLKWVAAVLEKYSKKEPLITNYSLDLLTRSITFDIRKARSEMGYEPLIGIEEGLRMTLKNITGKT